MRNAISKRQWQMSEDWAERMPWLARFLDKIGICYGQQGYWKHIANYTRKRLALWISPHTGEMSADEALLENFLTTLEDLHPYMRNICKQGGCYRLAKVLVALHPSAEICYTDERAKGLGGVHVVTKIGNRYYDIDGIYEPSKHPRRTEPRPIREYSGHQAPEKWGPYDLVHTGWRISDE